MDGILVFGDSIAFGRGESPSLGWVGRLKKDFELKSLYHCVFNLGVPGDTSKDVVKRLDTEAKARIRYLRLDDRFVIILAIGTNDARCNGSPTKNETSPAQFKKNILNLLRKAKKHTNEVLCLGLTPVDESRTLPFEETYFTNERNRQYNAIIRECCNSVKVPFFGHSTLWRDRKYSKSLKDGVHPSAKGYTKMYKGLKVFLMEQRVL